MARHQRTTRSLLLGATALAGALALSAGSAAAQQQEYSFDLPAQPLDVALRTYARTAEQQVIFAGRDVLGRKSAPVSGKYSAEEALQIMLSGSDLTVQRTAEGVLQVARAADPQGGSAGASVEALIVTAQKREEDIQDVPIAISAFSQEDLTRSQVAGGPDLMTQVPNMTFTKTNFTGYSIQIRGIGTQAISATTDPAVAVAFNNTPFVRNRFFEQEFYDLERVEVLRGPQGTLYGRNATAGVVNIISAKPKSYYEARVSGDVGNFSSSRLEGMVNLPLVEDVAAIRLAGAWTKRKGYTTNQTTGQQIDGRDLWSARATLGLEPTDALRVYLTYEHFEEDDDRLRSGKQLCKKDETPEDIAGVPLPASGSASGGGYYGVRSYIGQGCAPVSLYSDEAFQTPNGFTLPFYGPTGALGNHVNEDQDPYLSAFQSRDLRVIESSIEPSYRAKADMAHLQVNYDLTDALTMVSETAYSRDFTFSTQDYNRFTTAEGAFVPRTFGTIRPGLISDDGAFCDPQLGCSDTLLLGDLATATSTQFSQEIRLSSDFDGPFNFNLGANYLRYDTEDKYYVFVNSLTLLAAEWGEKDAWVPGVSDNLSCQNNLLPGDTSQVYGITECPYIDPNPIGSLNGLGHNYFLSKNPFKLISYAAFGEIYYEPLPDLEVVAGLRFTVDKKRAPRVPSQLLVSKSFGYPVADVVEQEWREPTGRLGVNWKPALTFTDETLLYASYARGYKAGGANPPTPVYSIYGAGLGDTTGQDAVAQRFLTQPRTFDAEYVDAYEIGSKNTMLGGKLTLNGSAFYYDYRGYQISQIVNRSAVNQNFDATIWGAELEADWRPLDNLRLGLKVGFEKTRLADGSQAIDLMDRTAGNPDYMVIKPFPTIPSNCIVPVDWVVRDGTIGINRTTCQALYYIGVTVDGLDPSTVPNNGEGILKDLSGNELPNAPDLTTTLTVDYTLPLPNEWLLTLHADLYRQSQAWTRVINFDPYDRLEAFSQVNLAAIFTNEDSGWNVMAYVKNAFDEDNITGAFLNSDDTGLTTNVFLNEPRLYGLRVTKAWEGGGWTGWLPDSAGEPDLYIELGGGILRADASGEAFLPAFISEFDASLRPTFGEGQEGNLDWGDSREVRLIYAPSKWGWAVSLGGRIDETNGRSWSERVEEADVAGWWGPVGFENANSCGGVSCYIEGGVYNYSRAETVHGEEHTAVDFMVGREVGLGTSRLWAGLRYADLRSIANTSLDGRPDYYLPEMFAGFCQPSGCAHVTDYTASVARESRFNGFGPSMQWKGVTRLWSLGDVGDVSFDWQAGGTVLFGQQEASVIGEITAAYYGFRIHPAAGLSTPRSNGVSNLGAPTVPAGFPIEVSIHRSDQVVVPNIQASLGFSYEVGRLKVSTGYRWNRYFDALDMGTTDSSQSDRTFDGPYFKLALGFGG